MTEAASLLQLLRLPRIGPVSLREILSNLTRIEVSPEKIHELTDECLIHDIRLTREQISALRNSDSDAEEDLDQCSAIGIETLLPSDSRFPRHPLSSLGPLAPYILFAWGELKLLQHPALGVSGSRRATDMSLAGLTTLCEVTASDGWVVISGGARGADEAAHLAAIRRGAGTIIVMPTGLFKPNIRKELIKHLEEGKVLLLSAFPPEQGWTPGSAMQRNRLLAALSRAVVLVEPGMRSGTAGTGKIALKLGVPLFLLDSKRDWNPVEIRFLKAGARSINPDGVTPKKLTLLLQRSWEKSEINRRSKPDSSSP